MQKPKWPPDTHIKCLLDDFSIDELVGAIKSKVQENGGSIQRPDALMEAARVREEEDYLRDRDQLMRDYRWIGGIKQPIAQTVADLTKLVADVNANHKFNIAIGPGQMGITIIRSGYVSLAIGYQQPIANYVGDSGATECHLWIAEYSGLLGMIGEGTWYVDHPKRLKLHKFKVDVGRDRGLLWRVDRKKEYIQASGLADYILRIFLDLISRANQGKVEKPHI
jgi:hypothetical protein